MIIYIVSLYKILDLAQKKDSQIESSITCLEGLLLKAVSTLTVQAKILTTLRGKPFEMLHEKENMLVMSLSCFSTLSETRSMVWASLLSAKPFIMDQFYGMDFTHYHTMTPFDAPGKQPF